MPIPFPYRHAISECLTTDLHRLHRSWRELDREKSANKKSERQEQLISAIKRSQEKVTARKSRLPLLSYPDLPVSAKADEIIAAIQQHQVIVLAGETGSGKTTQLPKLALAAGRGVQGYIGHTQPRRIAARSVAARIAAELNSPLGDLVGYKVRFTDEFSPDGFIKLMTDGVLLAELSHDRFLNAYDTIIIDEAHERSLNIDFLLGIIKQILPKRPDLKIIITSATIDVDRFSQHFSNAPVIQVEGRTYPVNVLYRPISENAIASDEDEGFDDVEENIPRAVLAAVDECLAHEKTQGKQGRGDILVFSSHEREIREIADTLRKYGPPHTEILPLYARLSVSEQQKVFQPGKGRRIVIATNVAETSLTVPNIHYVIDPGFARVSRYSYRSKVQRLPIEAVSQAAANQRKGRCGRIAPGLCIRLYSEADFLSRQEFTSPEIQRTNLAAVILQMQSLKLGDIDEFPFLDKPDSRYINDGFRLLEELGAVTPDRALTPIGRQLAKFPVEPRIARMLMEAHNKGVLREVLIIAAALGSQDPRDRPHDKQQAADERHAQFRHPESDFLWYVNLWDTLESQRGDLTESQRRDFARRHFLSWLRLREWRETHRQLLLLCKEVGWSVSSHEQRVQLAETKIVSAKNKPLLSREKIEKSSNQAVKADEKEEKLEAKAYEAVHQSLLSGLLSRIAQKSEEREYLATRQQKAFVFPGSVLAKKGPAWIMAAELVETQRVYARTVARIEPEWIEPLAKDLLKKSWFEPHWERRQGRVMAYEQVSLYGLTIIPRRKVNYEAINLQESREIFIRSALVENDISLKAPFFHHNQEMIEEVRTIEDKVRRRDILIDDESLFAFYDERIPAEIANQVSFETWRKKMEQENAQYLFLTKEYLLARDDTEPDDTDFPDHLLMGATPFMLEYRFEPGHRADGVTLLIPIGLLDEVDEARLDWLVPGLLQQKIEAMLKGLPKPVRRQLVPVPDSAAAMTSQLTFAAGSLKAALAQLLKQRGIGITEESWPDDIEDHYRFNLRVLAEEGKKTSIVAEGRDLLAIRRQVREQGGKHVSAASTQLERQNLASFPEEDIPDSVLLSSKGGQSRAYPALVWVQSNKPVGVDLRLFPTRKGAEEAHFLGLNRLFQIVCADACRQLKRRVSEHKSLILQYSPHGDKSALEEGFVFAVMTHVFMTGRSLVYTRSAFEQRLSEGQPRLLAEGERLLQVLVQSFAGLADVQSRLVPFKADVFSKAVNDVRGQIQALKPASFLREFSFDRWQHYPRYFKALIVRLEKLSNNVTKDDMATAEVAGRWKDYEGRVNTLAAREQTSQALEDYRWLLEEYRVSLFAQTVKTAVPVSATRLDKLWADIPK